MLTCRQLGCRTTCHAPAQGPRVVRVCGCSANTSAHCTHVGVWFAIMPCTCTTSTQSKKQKCKRALPPDTIRHTTKTRHNPLVAGVLAAHTRGRNTTHTSVSQQHTRQPAPQTAESQARHVTCQPPAAPHLSRVQPYTPIKSQTLHSKTLSVLRATPASLKAYKPTHIRVSACNAWLHCTHTDSGWVEHITRKPWHA